MAKSKTTTIKYPLPPMARPERERLYRQWAAKIVSELPSDEEGGRRVLQLAEAMRREWLAGKGQ